MKANSSATGRRCAGLLSSSRPGGWTLLEGGLNPSLKGGTALKRGCRGAAVATALVFCLPRGLIGVETSRESAARDVIEEFNVAGDGDALTVPLDIGARRYRFCVDTGASLVMVDKQLKPLLGRAIGSIRVQGLNGRVAAPAFESPALRLGKSIEIRPGRVTAHDFTMIRQASGHEIYGIIGMCALYSRVVRFDPDRGKLMFLKSAGSDAGLPVIFNYDGLGCPQVTATVADYAPQLFTVDTGLVGHSGSIEAGLFRQLRRHGELGTLGSSRIVDLAGNSGAVFGRVRVVRFGGFTCTNLAFDERTRDASNVLSLGYFSRFIVTFDFPRNVLYLKPGAQFDRPDLCDLSGLHFLRRHGEVIIDMVDAASPAEQVGIRANDVLLKVNGADMSTARLFPIRRLLSTPGKTIQLAIKRNGRRIERSLVLPTRGPDDETAPKIGCPACKGCRAK